MAIMGPKKTKYEIYPSMPTICDVYHVDIYRDLDRDLSDACMAL